MTNFERGTTPLALIAILAILAVAGQSLIGSETRATVALVSETIVETERISTEVGVSSNSNEEFIIPADMGIMGKKYKSGEIPTAFIDTETNCVYVTDIILKERMVTLTILNNHPTASYRCVGVGVNPAERRVNLVAGRDFVLSPGEQKTVTGEIIPLPTGDYMTYTMEKVYVDGGLFTPV